MYLFLFSRMLAFKLFYKVTVQIPNCFYYYFKDVLSAFFAILTAISGKVIFQLEHCYCICKGKHMLENYTFF